MGRICQHCGAAIDGSPCKRFCSGKCRKDHWLAHNRDSDRLAKQQYYRKHSEKLKNYAKWWKKQNLIAYRASEKRRKQRGRKALSREYIKSGVCSATRLRFKEIPESLVTSIRALIKLKRTKWRKHIYARGYKPNSHKAPSKSSDCKLE